MYYLCTQKSRDSPEIITKHELYMTYSEVYDLVSSTSEKNANVTITSKASGKKYRRNIYVSSANLLKIRGVNSKVVGYNVTSEMADHWLDIKLPTKRTSKQK